MWNDSTVGQHQPSPSADEQPSNRATATVDVAGETRFVSRTQLFASCATKVASLLAHEYANGNTCQDKRTNERSASPKRVAMGRKCVHS
uniref:Uncharacterized protein n=1 Tax=Ascaris lumbricoides TaxID=6252 RepID=A0A0M3HNB2_ASCLU